MPFNTSESWPYRFSTSHTKVRKLMYKQARQFPYYLCELVSDPEMKAKISVLTILQM